MRIAAYCRVSTDKDEQLDSLEHQKLFFTEYAQRQGHTLVRLYADEGISGTSLKNRNDFIQLMRDAQAGLFELVAVKDISRFARNTVDFLQSIRKLKSCGVNVLFLTANMESLGESEFVLTMFSALAQEESANLSKRVKFGKKINARKGRVPQCIFGYDRIDNYTLEINFEEAKVVREIFKLYVELGLGCRTLSVQLNSMGYRTKFNCEWNPRAVRRVLLNPIYCGRYVNNKYEVEDYLTQKRRLIPPDEHFHHDRPEWAIITPELFDKAQKQMDIRRSQYATEAAFTAARYSSRHLFSTLIKCEHCGRSFCRKYRKNKTIEPRIYWKCVTNDQYTSEKCDNSVKLEEGELLSEIRQYLASLIRDHESFIQGILSDIERENHEQSPRFSRVELERRRRSLLAKKERFREMYANDVITMTELKARVLSIDEELESLEDDSARLDQKGEPGSLAARYMAEIECFLEPENATNVDLREIIERIAVNRDGSVRVFLRELGDFDGE